MRAATAPAHSLLEEKAALRKIVRQRLRQFPTLLRSEEDSQIQRHVLEADWFKPCKRICAYISCSKLREVCTDDVIANLLGRGAELYVPRVLDSDSNMKMLRITSLADPEVDRSSMGIVEPKLLTSAGTPREDVMSSTEPLDVILLPGLAFDRTGARLGRGGGYYDVFLSTYTTHAREQGWKPPTLVALAYSIQIVDDVIPMDATDMHVDIIVTKDGPLLTK